MVNGRVLFIGSKALGISSLETVNQLSPESLVAVVTIDDSGDTRTQLENFYEFASRTGTPLHVLSARSELKSIVRDFRPDICLVVGWYWLISEELLNMVPGGWLGIHASLLPKYRGGAPLVWSIINGDKETGTSLFYLDPGMDTGDIVAQKRVSIEFGETVADVLVKVEKQSIGLVRENFPSILRGTGPRNKQSQTGVTYTAIRKPSDGIIDWCQPSETIYNFVRAQTHPYPGAFSYLGNKKIHIWAAKPFASPLFGTFGQIAITEGETVVVACGKGTGLSLESVQLEGLDEGFASDQLAVGHRLG